jgi:acetyl-CoA carboxylase biotin carboxyl carrier protein
MDSRQTDTDARRTIARLATDTLPRLIERLARSELGELEVRDDGWRIRLRKANGTNGEAKASADRPAVDRGQRTPTTSGGSHLDRGAAPRGSSQARRSEPPRGLITSPAVGYFAPRSDLAVGSTLRSGDVIGHVDVLGVRQEVVAPVDGTVAALEVESGQAIEYGQPIARLEQEASSKGGRPSDSTDEVVLPVEQLVEA